MRCRGTIYTWQRELRTYSSSCQPTRCEGTRLLLRRLRREINDQKSVQTLTYPILRTYSFPALALDAWTCFAVVTVQDDGIQEADDDALQCHGGMRSVGIHTYSLGNSPLYKKTTFLWMQRNGPEEVNYTLRQSRSQNDDVTHLTRCHRPNAL